MLGVPYALAHFLCTFIHYPSDGNQLPMEAIGYVQLGILVHSC